MEIKFIKGLFFFRKEILHLVMKTFVFLFCTTVFSFSPINIFGQDAKITIDADKTVTVYEVFDLIRGQTEYTFLYRSDIFKNTPKVHLKKGVIKANKLLEKSLSTNDFSFVLAADKSIVVKPKTINDVVQDPIKVTGKVTDETGVPLTGVTVRISGTNTGVATNFDGNYTITVPNANTVLVFSSLGFATKEIVVRDLTTINVTMQEAVNELDEVVLNAGYYNVSERQKTGSISKITSKTIEKQPVNNPLAAMQGHMAGVNIVQTTGVPGGGYNIEIRGKNFIAGSTNPLYIIDGVPYDSETLASNFVSSSIIPGANSSPLNAINSSDIENIEVLKDADATAIYGSRGANGVVLITTKKGKPGKTKIKIDLSSSLGQVTRFLDFMNTEQYLETRFEGLENDGFSALLDNPAFDGFWPDLKIWDQDRDTDWQKELIGGTAFRHSSQLSFSGGNNQTQFLASGGYQNETTVFPGDSNYGKASVHTSFSHQSTDNRLNLIFSVNYVAENNQLPGKDFTNLAYSLAPNAPALYDDEGNLNWEDNTWTNPLSILEADFTAKRHNLIANSVISYRPIPALELKTSLGYNDLRLDEHRTNPSTIVNPDLGRTSQASFIFVNNGTRRSWIIEPQINWQQSIGKAELNVLIGTTLQQRKSQRFSQFGVGFTSNSLIFDLSSANSVSILEDDLTEYNYQAIFGRINFKWEGRYILNLTGRRDGSSRFGPGRQFGNFWATGGAWLFSEEEFLKDNSLLSFGKIRASYGITGSDNVPDYAFLDTYSTSGDNYNGLTGLAPTRLFNPLFGWEENKKLEVALELGFLEDRLFLSTAWYRNRSSNQLIGIPLPGTTGFSSLTSNLNATVENRGVEVTLSSANFQKDNFKWSTSFNLTIPRNELIAFPGLESSTFANQFVIGESLNILKRYHNTGVNPDTGLYEFEDYNNDGVITAIDDRQWIEDVDPKFYGGIGNSLSYGNLQLDFFFQFKKHRATNFPLVGGIPGGLTQLSESVENRWQQPGDQTTIQRYSAGFNNDALNAFSRYFDSNAAFSDASFIRLRNVSLTYSIPRDIIRDMDASIYFQGQNLLTFTNYEGADPEQLSRGGFLPPLRQFTIGLNLSF